MITFRLAAAEDVPEMLELIKDFQKERLGELGFEVSPEYVVQGAMKHLDTAFVLEVNGQVGGILVLALATLVTNGEQVAEEIVWYVKKEYRRQGVGLLSFVEDWCVAQKISKLIMVCMANSKAKQIDRLYKRRGFVPLEAHYIKHLH